MKPPFSKRFLHYGNFAYICPWGVFIFQFENFKFFAAGIALCAMPAVMVAKATKPNRIYFPKIRMKIRGEVFLIKRRHFQNIGEIWGIAQLGAHVTSETPPNLFINFEKLAVDNLRKMYYNKQRWLVNRRKQLKNVLEEVHMGV